MSTTDRLVKIAKKDIRDGIRSKLLLGLIALFVLIMGGFSALSARGSGADDLLALLGFASILVVIVLVPVTGLVVSFKSITRERESGSLNVLLSLPFTRTDVFFGKFIGRSTLLITAILAGFVPAGIILLLATSEPFVWEYTALVLVTILFGIIFVAFGVSLSAVLQTETQATIGGIGAFVLLYFWNNIFNFINSELSLLSGDALLLVQRFALFNVFLDSLLALFSLNDGDIPNASWVVLEQGFGQPEQAEVASQPFYLQHWFAFVILALWITIPLAVAHYQFNRTDL